MMFFDFSMILRSVFCLAVSIPYCFLLVSCNGKSDQSAENTVEFEFPYDFSSPDVYELDDVMHEISGISPLPDSTGLLAINDESGKLFWLDMKGRITKWKWFHKGGDYEDLAVVGNGVFVMKSNGNLYHVPDFSLDSLTAVTFKADAKDEVEFESLALDQKSNRLLLLVKDGESVKSQAPFYGFDLGQMKFQDGHVLMLEPRKAPDVTTKGRSFRSSAMAFHPITGHLYVVASINKMLLICDRNGNGVGSVKLNKKMFPQPEGLCFLPNGDMFISTEGKSKSAKLLRFQYLPGVPGAPKPAN